MIRCARRKSWGTSDEKTEESYENSSLDCALRYTRTYEYAYL